MKVRELIDILERDYTLDAEVGQILFYRHFAKLEQVAKRGNDVTLWFDTVNCEEKA